MFAYIYTNNLPGDLGSSRTCDTLFCPKTDQGCSNFGAVGPPGAQNGRIRRRPAAEDTKNGRFGCPPAAKCAPNGGFRTTERTSPEVPSRSGQSSAQTAGSGRIQAKPSRAKPSRLSRGEVFSSQDFAVGMRSAPETMMLRSILFEPNTVRT